MTAYCQAMINTITQELSYLTQPERSRVYPLFVSTRKGETYDKWGFYNIFQKHMSKYGVIPQSYHEDIFSIVMCDLLGFRAVESAKSELISLPKQFIQKVLNNPDRSTDRPFLAYFRTAMAYRIMSTVEHGGLFNLKRGEKAYQLQEDLSLDKEVSPESTYGSLTKDDDVYSSVEFKMDVMEKINSLYAKYSEKRGLSTDSNAANIASARMAILDEIIIPAVQSVGSTEKTTISSIAKRFNLSQQLSYYHVNKLKKELRGMISR